jgi:hypothetical protein
MRKFGLLRLKDGTKRTYQDDDWKKDIQDHCAAKVGNDLQAPAVRQRGPGA